VISLKRFLFWFWVWSMVCLPSDLIYAFAVYKDLCADL
jgi:hypothetical protein